MNEAFAIYPDGDNVPPACEEPLGPVLRLYDPDSATLDLRTGLLCEGLPTGDDLRRLILATLPSPLAP